MNPPFVKKQGKGREKGEPHVNIENENMKQFVNIENTKKKSVVKTKNENTLGFGKIMTNTKTHIFKA
jgi:hypothetical protein